MLHERTLVLVVDDEAEQLQTLSRGLFMLGIDCLAARDEEQAVAELRGPFGAHVDLLLTDLTRPGRSGARLIERARASRPGLPALVITGLAPSPQIAALRASGIPILRKPFTPEQLGHAIGAALTAITPPTPES